MRIFYYVHTGHRIGLDRFRRAATIIRALHDIEITLLCSDFRIAHIACEFGVENSVGIDVVRNIPNIAQRGDKIIFDSEEANSIMLEDMRSFFSTFIRVSDNINDKKESGEFLISPYLKGEGIYNDIVVDDKFFAPFKKTTPLSFFFGDDDYEKDLEKNITLLDGLEPTLQLGFYYFLDYEEILKEKFKHSFEFEEYEQMITSSEILITSSPQATLECLASGGKPIYIIREDYENNFNSLFIKLNIPIINNYNKTDLSVVLSTINNIKYQKIVPDSNNFTHFIKETLYK